MHSRVKPSHKCNMTILDGLTASADDDPSGGIAPCAAAARDDDAPARHSIAPRRAGPSPVVADMTAADAVAALLGASAGMVERNALVMMLSDIPGGPHQFRVGLRRMRTALRAGRWPLGRERLRPLELLAKRLGQAASAWRDADVMLSDIAAPAIAAGAVETGAAELRRHLALSRERAVQTSRAALCDLAPTGLIDAVDALATAPDTPDPKRAAKPAAALATRMLSRAWADVADWGARIEDLSVPERHEMRKALKTLRYSADAVAPLFPSAEAAGFAKRLRKLQTVFGYLNDVAMAETLSAAAPAQTAGAAAAVLDWHQQRLDAAWDKALERWAKLSAEPRYWAAPPPLQPIP